MAASEDQIAAELAHLIGLPLVTFARAADMAMFGFGPRIEKLNRKGEPVQVAQVSLHIQCRWRFCDADRVLFGRDDLNYPADPKIDLFQFDSDRQDSILDVEQRAWFEAVRSAPVHVLAATGDRYGGFHLELERRFVMAAFPCGSRPDEKWRLLGHRENSRHFVVQT